MTNPAFPLAPQAEDATADRWARWFWIFLLSHALFRLVYSSLVPLTGDEVMHWEWSRHLALGYPEHPPLIAWAIRAATTMLGTYTMAVRVMSVLVVTGTFAMAFQLGRELFGNRAGFLGVAPLMVTPLYCAGGTLANTDGMLGFFWVLTAYAVKHAVIDKTRTAWIFVGVFTGLCLLSKMPGVFLFFVVLLFLATGKQTRLWLKRPEPYLAALLALIIDLPPVIWNWQNDWFTLTMRVGHDAATGFTLKYFFELVGAQLLTITPVLFVWAMWAYFRSWKYRADDRVRLLTAFATIPFLFYFGYSLTARAGVHWPGPGYITSFILAGAFTAAWPVKRARRWLLAGVIPAVLLLAVLYTVPLAPDLVANSAAKYSGRPDKIHTGRFESFFEWSDLGREVEHELDKLQTDPFMILEHRYGLAGSTAFYTPSHPDTYLWIIAGRNGAAYDLWKLAAERDGRLLGRDAVIVDDVEDNDWFEELECCFDEVSEPRHVKMYRKGKVVKNFWILRATGFQGFPPEQSMVVGE